MPKNSKKRRHERRIQQEAEKAKKLERKRAALLPASIATFDSKGVLPPSVAVNPDILEKGDKKYQITFRNLNLNVCDFNILNETCVRAFLKKFKDIADKEPRHASDDHIFRDNIENNGEYRPLFQGLTDDITMKEIEFAEEGRIFCYTIQHHLNIVAIWTKHANQH